MAAAAQGRGIQHLRAMTVLVGVAALVIYLPFAEHGLLYLILIGLLICVALPAAIAWSRGRFDPWETINIIGLRFLVFFGFGAIWTAQDPEYIAYDIYILPYLPKAAFYCLLGYIGLLIGYFGPWWHGRAKSVYRAEPVGETFVLATGLVGLTGYLSYALWVTRGGAGLPAFVGSLSQASPLFLLAWGLSWIQIFSGRANRRLKMIVGFIFIPGVALITLLTFSNKSLITTLCGIPVIAMWYAKKKIPWVALTAILLVLVFVIFPVYNTYRTVDSDLGSGRRLEATFDKISGWESESYLQGSVGAFKRRVALINSLAIVLRDCPRWVPYAQGRTIFYPIATFFVPRFLWPGKPEITAFGREFGETFQIVHSLDDKTFIAPTLPGELCWNFDLPGIVFGLGVWGVFLRWTYRRYGEKARFDPIRQSMHIVALVHFSHAAHVLGVAVTATRTLILLEVVYWLARTYGFVRTYPVEESRPAGESASSPEMLGDAAPSGASLR